MAISLTTWKLGKWFSHQHSLWPAAPRGRREPQTHPSAPARPVTAPPGRGRLRAPGDRRGARGVGRGPGGQARPSFTWSPRRAQRRTRGLRRPAGASRRPSFLLAAAAQRPAGSWAEKEEAAGRAPPRPEKGRERRLRGWEPRASR